MLSLIIIDKIILYSNCATIIKMKNVNKMLDNIIIVKKINKTINHYMMKDRELKKYLQLEVLDISNNYHIVTNIKKLVNLTHLNCRGTNIIDQAFTFKLSEGIGNFNLKYLNCSRTNITDEGIKHLVTLKYLNCNYCFRITNEGIKNLVNLTHLSRGWTGITHEGIINLINLKKLYHPNGDIEIIKQMLPNCEIKNRYQIAK